MKSNNTALALALLIGGIALASPASAQNSSPPPASPPQATSPTGTPARAAPNYDISKQARQPIIELQAAVNAKDTANIPAKLAAAQAKAKTKDDKYVIAQLQLKAAADRNDTATMSQAIDAMIASGAVPAADMAGLYNTLGKIHYNAKAFDRASAAFQRVLQLDPNNVDAMVMQGEALNSQGRTAEGVALFQKAIAARVAAGQKPEESWYKRGVALAYNAKLPNAAGLGREWVAAYPSPKNWRDAIRIYQTGSNLDDSALIDSMRLMAATGALSGENDHYRLASTLMLKGYPGEAKAVLDQGFAAKSIDKAKPTFSQLYALASTKAQGDRASLSASAKTALAAPTAKQAMTTADAYYGYGDYAQAAELYRAALTKSGVDKDIANLRLGMALARAGDKPGATAALNAAGGAQAEIAKFWLVYVNTRA